MIKIKNQKNIYKNKQNKSESMRCIHKRNIVIINNHNLFFFIIILISIKDEYR